MKDKEIERIEKKIYQSAIYSGHLVVPKKWLKKLQIENAVWLSLYEDRIVIRKKEG